MSGAALSRLLEAVAKSIRHSVAMSTILATELFQARQDAAIATSKLLVENSGYKKGKRKVQGVPQSKTAVLPRPQEEEETDKSKQAQPEQTYKKH